MSEYEQVARDMKNQHQVEIQLNKKPVRIGGPQTTGLKVKEAAIAQGVAIQLDFQLAEIRGKKHVVIGDGDDVTVHNGSQFVATAGDDNSRG